MGTARVLLAFSAGDVANSVAAMNALLSAVIGISVSLMPKACASLRAISTLSLESSSLMPLPQPAQWSYQQLSACLRYDSVVSS